MDYAPLADLKLAVNIPAGNTDNDVLLQAALDAAKEAIDAHCNRTFVASVAASTRRFEVIGRRVEVDDIYTLTDLAVSVGGNVVPAAVDYVSAGYTIGPRNALALGEPFTEIEYTGSSSVEWPYLAATGRSWMTVLARWGFALDVPPSVYQACLLQASRIYSRRNSPYGVAGSPDLGSEMRLLAKVDADVAVLLAGKIRY